MDVQKFIRRARGRWNKAVMHGGKDTVTITARMPIDVTVPLAGVREHEWDELVRLIDDRVWDIFMAMKPKEKK
jgi:hypothetical protein